MRRILYPFTAFVEQEKVKTALILNAVDPRLGGVLVVGPKGSGKSTIIRALEDVLPEIESIEDCLFNCNPSEPSHICSSCRERLERDRDLQVMGRRVRIVELPLGATEDGLLGTVDAERALREGVKALQPGLLARANHNILYIDEVNLLPDHIVDCILDPAVSGWNVVQREGLRLNHPSRFTLFASMNPEEGGLRPQILDRFALKVEMDRTKNPDTRTEITRRNLSFEEDPKAFYETYREKQTCLQKRIEKARESLRGVEVPEGIINGIAELCSKLGVEGARPDLAILKAARALAAFNARSVVESEDVLEVFDFAVGHRIKEDGTVARGRLSKKELRRILSSDTSTRVVEISEKELPVAETSLDPTHPPSSPVRGRVRRIRIPKPLDYVLYVMTLAVLLLALSFVSSTMSALIRAIVFRTPITVLQEALSPFQILLHFLLWASILMATALISRRLRRPIIYLYTYLGQGGRRQIVQRQFQPDQGEISAGKKGERSSVLINVPIYASLRRLYRILVTKGMKLLDVVGVERKRYRFSFETRRDRRIRSLVGRQRKTRARSEHGSYVSYEFPKRRPWDVALGPTLRAAAPFQRSRLQGDLAIKVEVEDIRVKVREMRAPVAMVLLLDMSESMVPALVNVRNAVLSMHDILSKKRSQVGLVIFKGQGAVTLQRPTSNLGLVAKKLMEVGASDLTPLASGMFEARRVLRNEKVKNRDTIPVLVIISDGITNVPLESPVSMYARPRFINKAQADVVDVAQLLQREGIRTLVINPSHTSPGSVASLAAMKRLAERAGKQWMEPTELLLAIPEITGGWYYGIGEEGELEEVILTEALGVLK